MKKPILLTAIILMVGALSAQTTNKPIVKKSCDQTFQVDSDSYRKARAGQPERSKKFQRMIQPFMSLPATRLRHERLDNSNNMKETSKKIKP